MTRLVRLLAPRFVALTSLLALPALLGSVPQARPTAHDSPVAQDAAGEVARISVENARILNLADPKGVAVASPTLGSLVTIHDRSQAGWLLVEVPGGYPVWVFGRYLEGTGDEGIYEVTRNAVNIRPGPSSDVTNFPLPQRLHAGDRVRVIETLDPSKPLAETWARIWSPTEVWAWIDASSVTALAADENGAEMWRIAQNESVARIAPEVARSGAAEAATEATSAESIARAELDAALATLETEGVKEAPDYGTVRAAIEAVLAKTPSGPTMVEARQTLRRLDALEEALSLRVELLRERERRAQNAVAEQKRVWEASKKKDPLGDVFLSRGVLFRRRDRDGVTRYRLRFGGETVSELFCPSGRYDLEQFAGYEIGVLGTEYKSAEEREIPALEVSRLEIIKRR